MAGQREPASVSQVTSLTARLALPRPDATDPERLELIRALEDLNRASAAAQAVLSEEFERSQRAQQEAEGVPAERVGTGVADDLALAGKLSPARSSNRLACCRALAREMPQTLDALASGVIDLAQAEIITRATACLSVEDRATVDGELSGRLTGLSTKQIRDTVNALVYELDPQVFVRRARRAAEDAYVSMRPAPDVMCVISAMLPAAQGVAVYAALKSHAEGLRASGDPRNQGKIMADTLYATLTGLDPVTLPDIELHLLMTDATLMSGDTVAAFLDGYGPVPAQNARDLLIPPAASEGPMGELGPDAEPGLAGDLCPEGSHCADWSCSRLHGTVDHTAQPQAEGERAEEKGGHEPPTHAAPASEGPVDEESVDQGSLDEGSVEEAKRASARVFVRRLYADSLTGEVFARDSRRRFFPAADRALIISRDRYCRSPWCGAPIRHIDHRIRHRDGGGTSTHNGQGLCQRCNQGRERPRQTAVPPTLYLRASSVLPRLRSAHPPDHAARERAG